MGQSSPSPVTPTSTQAASQKASEDPNNPKPPNGTPEPLINDFGQPVMGGWGRGGAFTARRPAPPLSDEQKAAMDAVTAQINTLHKRSASQTLLSGHGVGTPATASRTLAGY